MTNLAIINGRIAGSGWDFGSAPAICGGGEDEYCAVGASVPVVFSAIVSGTLNVDRVRMMEFEFHERSARDLMKVADAIRELDPEFAYGFYSVAIEEFKKAGSADGRTLAIARQVETLQMLGSMLVEDGKPQEAVERFRQAAKLDPFRDIEIFKVAGDLLMEHARTDGSLAHSQVVDHGRAALAMYASVRNSLERASKVDHLSVGRWRLAELEVKMEIIDILFKMSSVGSDTDKEIVKCMNSFLVGIETDFVNIESSLIGNSIENDQRRLTIMQMKIRNVPQLIALVRSGHGGERVEMREGLRLISADERNAVLSTALERVKERDELIAREHLAEALIKNEEAANLLRLLLRYGNKRALAALTEAVAMQVSLHAQLDAHEGFADTPVRRDITRLLEKAESNGLPMDELYEGLAHLFHTRPKTVQNVFQTGDGTLGRAMRSVMGDAAMERFSVIVRDRSGVRKQRGSRKGMVL